MAHKLSQSVKNQSNKGRKSPHFRSFVAVPLLALVATTGFTLPTIAGAVDNETDGSETVVSEELQPSTEATEPTSDDPQDPEPAPVGASAEEVTESDPTLSSLNSSLSSNPEEDEGAAVNNENAVRGNEEESEEESESTRDDTRAMQVSCAPGSVYAINGTTGVITGYGNASGTLSLPTEATATSNTHRRVDMNSLAVAKDGKVYAIVRHYVYRQDISNPNDYYVAYKYDGTNWTAITDRIVTEQTESVIAGAVSPIENQYMWGYYQNVSRTLARFYIHRSINGVNTLVGYINVSRADDNNGDMAFDGQGNLTVVRGYGNHVDLFMIDKDELANANGGRLNTTKAISGQEIEITNVNGAAYDADGNIWIGNYQGMYKYDPRLETFVNGNNGQPLYVSTPNSYDLASCISPPTLEIRKALPKGRFNENTGGSQSEQFRLVIRYYKDLEDPNTEYDYAVGMTRGDGTDVAGGVVATVVKPGQRYKFTESVLEQLWDDNNEPISTYNPKGVTINDFTSTWECTYSDGSPLPHS